MRAAADTLHEWQHTCEPLHTCEEFAFTANAPLDVTWPLFGADKERVWAPDWNPVFVWPKNALDQEGMVFKVPRGDKTAVWVNTALDRAANRLQYVYVLADVMVTVITLQLAPIAQGTHVTVTYSRTALEVAANDLVREMANQDRGAGGEWALQINTYLLKGAVDLAP
ncbi:MAG TPA: hypothetical protein VGN99_08105 [Steroidobacteraceae bacterium]|jgi:uncharacterized membrane protein (UPF0127 family)|nr:hypothetical protein [Steroidobacteraceae bacterium]